MGFFDEFFKEIDINDNDFCVNIILQKGIYLSGVLKVVDLNDKFMIIDIKNKKYKILGSELSIKSLAKNELIVNGNILGFVEVE